MTPAQAQAEVIALINDFGSTVTLHDGSTTPAIVDEDMERITREMPLELEGHIEGRPALFDFLPSANVKANDVVTYDGQRWRMHPTRKVNLDGTVVRKTFLGTAGAPIVP